MGLRYKIAKDVKWTSAVTFYEYTNIDSAFINDAYYKTFAANGRGNTVVGGHLASSFPDSTSSTRSTSWRWACRGTSSLTTCVNDNPDLPISQREGLAAGIKVGANKKKGDWSAWYVWKHLESDATLALFTESDFGYDSTSYTNKKGSQFGVAYNLTDSMTAGVTLFFVEPITGSDANRFTFQGDLVWKF